MPIFKFYGGNGLSTTENNLIATSVGSGLGFFGLQGSGTSVQVASYQDTTYVTDANGANPKRACNNIKYTHASSGKISDGSNYDITAITNAQATLQIRFQQDNGGANIRTQNVKVWPYDRNSSTSWPSSVVVKLVELQHTGANNVVETRYDGTTTSATWTSFHYDPDLVAGGYVYGNPSSTGLSLYPSPGQNGLHPLGTSSTGLYHDWYLGISASPDTIGSKNFGLWVELEYTEV